MNSFTVTGRIGQDPEVRYATSGTAIAEFNLANNTGFGDKRKTHWFNIVAFGKMAEYIGNHVAKGNKVLVSGEGNIQQWEKDGNKRSKFVVLAKEFELLERKQQDNSTPFGGEILPEEEIPF